MTPVWARDLADRFWHLAGPPPAFPRDLSRAAVDYGLAVVARPGLTLDAVRQGVGRPVAGDVPDRPLRACLYAHAGVGMVFLDAADPADERRFSLAHEVAHFLRDVDAPRRRAESVGAVPGRPASADVRLAAALQGVDLRPHLHLMGRDDAGRPLTTAEHAAEAAADRLAGELLAPGDLFADDPADVIELRLVAEFGLPPGPAAGYARTLRPPAWRDPLVGHLFGPAAPGERGA